MLRHLLDGAGRVIDRDRPRAASMKSSRFTASLCSRTKSKLLVEPGWLLKATQGLMHVDEGGAVMADRRHDQRHQLLLVAGEAARDEGRAEQQRHADQIDRRVGVGRRRPCSSSPCRRWRRTGPWSGRTRRCSRRYRPCSRRGGRNARTGPGRSRRSRRRRKRPDRSGRGWRGWRRSAPTACGHARS